jgi:hypothetical protein
VVIGALVTTIEAISQHKPMTQKLTTTVFATRREGTHGTFETIEHMSFPTQMNFKARTAIVPTDFATDVPLHIFHLIHKSPFQIMIGSFTDMCREGKSEDRVSDFPSSSPLGFSAFCSLCFLDILTTRPLLRGGWLGSFGYVSARLRLKYITLSMYRFFA